MHCWRIEGRKEGPNTYGHFTLRLGLGQVTYLLVIDTIYYSLAY